jgi:hypothetical protein
MIPRIIKKFLRLWMAASLCAGLTAASAAPWLGLVKTGTTTQTNDTITLGTSIYNMDVRFDSGNNPVNTLQYTFYTTPTNSVTFGTNTITTLNSPFTSSDIWASPAAGSYLNNNSTNATIFFKSGSGDYAATTNNVATYQINTSTLGAGLYVFAFATNNTDSEYMGWSGGDLYTSDFAAPGTFVLDVVSVPEPATWTLMVVGGWVVGWKIRRRHAR